jgi:hypothetical protein
MTFNSGFVMPRDHLMEEGAKIEVKSYEKIKLKRSKIASDAPFGASHWDYNCRG